MSNTNLKTNFVILELNSTIIKKFEFVILRIVFK